MVTNKKYSQTAMPDVAYPIENYGQLKQSVQLWFDRDDNEFVSQIPNFIDFAQKEIQRNLRWPCNQKEAYLYIKNGIAPIPSDWLQNDYIRFIDMHLEFRETSLAEYVYKKNSNPHATIDVEKEIIFTRPGSGKYWYFWPAINAPIPTDKQIEELDYTGDEVVLGYFWDVPRLINDSDSNDLLELCPDILLYSSLKHAAVFVNDSDAEAMWKDREEVAIKGLNEQMKQQKRFATPVSLPQPNARAFW